MIFWCFAGVSTWRVTGGKCLIGLIQRPCRLPLAIRHYTNYSSPPESVSSPTPPCLTTGLQDYPRSHYPRTKLSLSRSCLSQNGLEGVLFECFLTRRYSHSFISSPHYLRDLWSGYEVENPLKVISIFCIIHEFFPGQWHGSNQSQRTFPRYQNSHYGH